MCRSLVVEDNPPPPEPLRELAETTGGAVPADEASASNTRFPHPCPTSAFNPSPLQPPAAQEAQRQAEEKYRGIFENALDGIFQTTPDGHYLSANPALAAMYGYASAAELLADVTDIGRQLYVEPGRRAEFARLVETQGRVTGFESQIRRKDGTVIWISENARAVRDARGRLLYYEGFQRDITERKALEEQLRQAQKMEAVGRLAGGVAHDFNNALTVINGYSEVLLAQLAPGHATRGPLEEIHKAGERAAVLTRQLLAFSRLQVLNPTELDLNALVSSMAPLLRSMLGEDVVLDTILDPEPCRMKADAGHVEQVLINLAMNAREAMAQGGRLTLETQHVELDAGCAEAHVELRPGRYVVLAVSDTGVGMAPEVKARIFEPFFTTKGAGRGTGLATVYGIVKQSGGSISVSSTPGRGTTFRVYLPRLDRPLPASAPAGAAAPRGCETVLLVEDQEDVRRLVGMTLRLSGYKVLEASNGAEALRVAEQHAAQLHLLVTDVVMPGMSGRELAERLAGVRPGLLTLYLSGYTDDAVVRHGVLAAATAFLQKPFAVGALARKVREVLDDARPVVPHAV